MDDTNADTGGLATARMTRPCGTPCSDSRQRWRDLVLTAADLAYETDAWGRFVFVMPDPALGWSAATLIGQPAELLLAGGIEAQRLQSIPRHRAGATSPRLAASGADGTAVMLAFSAAPLLDAEGRIVGTRGMGVDWTEFDEHAGSRRRGAAPRRGAGSYPVAHGPGGAGAAHDAGGAGRADQRARRRGRRGDRRARRRQRHGLVHRAGGGGG